MDEGISLNSIDVDRHHEDNHISVRQDDDVSIEDDVDWLIINLLTLMQVIKET